jgi:hypothetical protein
VGASGSPAGEEVRVGASGFYWAASPDIAEQAPGEFVVVWNEASYEYGYDDSGDYIRIRSFDVEGRIVDQDGAPTSDVFVVSPNGYRGTSVATDAAGNFVVAWPRFSEDTGYRVYARRFDASGAPSTSAARVDSGATGTTGKPTSAGKFGARVAMTGDGHFAVVWSEGGTGYKGNTDGDAAGVFGRTFEANGSPQGPERTLNAQTAGAQQTPSIVFGSDQTLAVTWQSEDRDGSGFGIAARRFARTAPCGDATVDGTTSASDALFALQTAVGTRECAACICDVNDSGGITVVDALAILYAGLGVGSVGLCPACP